MSESSRPASAPRGDRHGRRGSCGAGAHRRGELGALDDLYERYKTMAYSIAYRITNDATLAEDVVQDALPRCMAECRPLRRGARQRQDVAAVDRPSPRDRCVRRRRPTTASCPTPAMRRRRRSACPTSGRRSRRTSMPTPCAPRWRPLRRPARSDRARLLRRADPGRDRRPDGHATRDRQEPDAPRPPRDAPMVLTPWHDARRPAAQPRRGPRPGGVVRPGRAR